MAGKKRKISSSSATALDDIVDSAAQGKSKTLLDRDALILKIRELMLARDKARREQDFAKSDNIRDLLSDLGVFVQDQRDGPSGWRFLDGSSKKLSNEGLKVLNKSQLEPKDALNESAPKSKKSRTNLESGSNSAVEQERNKTILSSLSTVSENGQNKQGVIIRDVTVGTGEVASLGMRVKVDYVGRLKATNKVFDSSRKPFAFTIGRGEVIRGWDIGVSGMRIGGKRILTIPPEKAYGKSGAPPSIPPNATLIFEIRLIAITKK